MVYFRTDNSNTTGIFYEPYGGSGIIEGILYCDEFTLGQDVEIFDTREEALNKVCPFKIYENTEQFIFWGTKEECEERLKTLQGTFFIERDSTNII